MEIEAINSKTEFLRYSIKIDGKEIGRTYVYLIKNDIHKRPYAFIEDVFIEENYRSQGLGKKIMEHIYNEAKKLNCYKIVLCCKHENPKAYKFYEKINFQDQGTKFRIDL